MEDLSFFQKPVSDLDYPDIEWLKNERIPEGYNLDYKRVNYEKNKTDELAKDISALANTSGGYLVLGLEETKDSDEGETYPGEIVGIEKEEDLKKRIRDRIITSIMPHPEIHFSDLIEIPGKSDRVVLVIYVPKSFDSLHMVVVKKRNCYYKRYHDQNVPMDEYEVRIRYDALQKSESKLEKQVETITDELYNNLYFANYGALFVSTAPFFTSAKFDNIEIVNSIVHNPDKFKHPRVITVGLTGSCAPEMHLDYILKVDNEEKPRGVIKFFYNGAVGYGTSEIFSRTIPEQPDTESQRYILSHRLCYELYYLLPIIQEYYAQNKYFGYIMMLVTIKNLEGSIFGFNCNDPLFRAMHATRFKRMSWSSSTTVDVIYLHERRMQLIDEFVLPLFYEAGLDKSAYNRYCWDSEGKPLT